MFSLALGSLKVDTYEQWIEPLFDALMEQIVLDDKHAAAKIVPYVVGLVDMGGQMTVAGTMWHFNGLYEPPRVSSPKATCRSGPTDRLEDTG